MDFRREKWLFAQKILDPSHLHITLAMSIVLTIASSICLHFFVTQFKKYFTWRHYKQLMHMEGGERWNKRYVQQYFSYIVTEHCPVSKFLPFAGYPHSGQLGVLHVKPIKSYRSIVTPEEIFNLLEYWMWFNRFLRVRFEILWLEHGSEEMSLL